MVGRTGLDNVVEVVLELALGRVDVPCALDRHYAALDIGFLLLDSRAGQGVGGGREHGALGRLGRAAKQTADRLLSGLGGGAKKTTSGLSWLSSGSKEATGGLSRLGRRAKESTSRSSGLGAKDARTSGRSGSSRAKETSSSGLRGGRGRSEETTSGRLGRGRGRAKETRGCRLGSAKQTTSSGGLGSTGRTKETASGSRLLLLAKEATGRCASSGRGSEQASASCRRGGCSRAKQAASRLGSRRAKERRASGLCRLSCWLLAKRAKRTGLAGRGGGRV